MRFLADENLDFAVVRALRGAGHDVRALVEETSQTIDAEVIALAARERRILLTEDKDFGWLALVAGDGGEGVILVRFPTTARQHSGLRCSIWSRLTARSCAAASLCSSRATRASGRGPSSPGET